MKRILSYSIFKSPKPVYWRSDTKDGMAAYARFLPVLVRIHQAIWPGYEMRIHHDPALEAFPYFPALVKMQERGIVRLIPCGPAKTLNTSTLWRFCPMFEADADVVVTCDADSLPILRLRRMVEEFAASGKAAMVAHGCETHNGVMAGLMAVRAPRFRELLGVGAWEHFIDMGRYGWHAYGDDEDFLRKVVWPRLADEGLLYHNPAWPAPIIPAAEMRCAPEVPPPADLLPEVVAHGDDFAPYIGSAGYDISGAFHFYQGLPLPVMDEIRQCEGESLALGEIMRL